jgi:hypothetical protein
MIRSAERIFPIFDMVPVQGILHTVLPQVFVCNIISTVKIVITLQGVDIIFYIFFPNATTCPARTLWFHPHGCGCSVTDF